VSDVRRLALAAGDRRTLAEACERLDRHDIVSKADDFVIEAQLQAARLSSELRRALLEFRRFGHPSGGLLIKGVPTDRLSPAPGRADDPRGAGAAALSVFIACLGDQYGFRPELGGNIVQDILPVQGFERQQISVGSTVDLHAHTETAFSPYRPDYVALLCLRPDHEHRAGTTLSSIDAMLPLLDEPIIEVLRKPRFRTKIDSSFLIGDNLSDDVCIDPICVFEGAERRPRLRVDFDGANGTIGNDPVAQRAVEALRDAAIRAQIVVRLEAGEILILDNNRAVHGRTPFVPRYDGQDRWLLRAFVTRDLGRSEGVRPGDGRVVQPDYLAEEASA